jgi:putative oxidoreductase
MKLGITILRVAVGGTLFAHGAQKLLGWFGGPGPDGTAQGFERIGLKPGKRNALVAGGSEAGGGALLAAGLTVPLGAAATVAVMSEAVRKVHWDKGFFSTAGGYEYNLVLGVAAIALADTGPGAWSLDRVLGIEMSGPEWALAALGAGLAGPRLLERLAPPEEPEAEPQPEPQRFVRDTESQPAQRTSA